MTDNKTYRERREELRALSPMLADLYMSQSFNRLGVAREEAAEEAAADKEARAREIEAIRNLEANGYLATARVQRLRFSGHAAEADLVAQANRFQLLEEEARMAEAVELPPPPEAA